jgi:hypothetical protein
MIDMRSCIDVYFVVWFTTEPETALRYGLRNYYHNMKLTQTVAERVNGIHVTCLRTIRVLLAPYLREAEAIILPNRAKRKRCNNTR